MKYEILMMTLFRETDGIEVGKNPVVVRYKKGAHSIKLSPTKYNFI